MKNKLDLRVKKIRKDHNRLYIMRFTVPEYDGFIYKIGKTSGVSSKNRMLSIISSYYDAYRLTPVVKIVRDREVVDGVFDKEAALHEYFHKNSYTPDRQFSGFSEFFAGVEEAELIARYEECLVCTDINHTETKEE